MRFCQLFGLGCFGTIILLISDFHIACTDRNRPPRPDLIEKESQVLFTRTSFKPQASQSQPPK
jgi:hypothetical protein